ncbi:MAG: carbonic anhydrase family protein [Gammaproteobacteria bacterium]
MKKILSQEANNLLTPLKAIQLLKDGNQRFINNLKINRNLLQQVNETSDEQNPFAIILSCIDSRTSAELIFDQGLGDIFSVRIAGNIVNEDILGSMEFACKFAGAQVIVVLGHTKCGAVKGVCDGVEVGNLSLLLEKLKPAVHAEKTITINRNSKNVEFMEKVATLNVTLMIDKIMEKSPLLKSMIDQKQIAIVGGMYNVDSGKVDFYDI